MFVSKFSEKAYRNPNFLNSASARPVCILAEYLEPSSRLVYHKIKDTAVFFSDPLVSFTTRLLPGSSRAQILRQSARGRDT